MKVSKHVVIAILAGSLTACVVDNKESGSDSFALTSSGSAQPPPPPCTFTIKGKVDDGVTALANANVQYIDPNSVRQTEVATGADGTYSIVITQSSQVCPSWMGLPIRGVVHHKIPPSADQVVSVPVNGTTTANLHLTNKMYSARLLSSNDVDSGLGINAAGAVTGYAFNGVPLEKHAVVWPSSGGVMNLGAGLLPGGTWAKGVGINSAGYVVGQGETIPAGAAAAVQRGFIYDVNALVMTDLGTLGGPNSQANAINDSLVVVGTADVAVGVTHGVLWDPINGTVIDLEQQSPGVSIMRPRSINARGDIAGSAKFPAGFRAFYIPESGFQVVQLGTLPNGGDSYAQDINDSVFIVGEAQDAAVHTHAVHFVLGAQQAVPFTETSATFTSTADNTNGSSDTVGGINGEPVLWKHDSAFVTLVSDLTTASFNVNCTPDINDNGQILVDTYVLTPPP